MDLDPVDSLGDSSRAAFTFASEFSKELNILSLSWNSETLSFDVEIGTPILSIILALLILLFTMKVVSLFRGRGAMEIDQAEIGVGDTKISFRPNLTDRQVAYAIWVELSTRKIGLPIDLQDDVIAEIYDSWYNYFSVTRELIKTISVTEVRNKSTRQIINLSINVLNSGLRPHLTKWQARYRHWYQQQVERIDKNANEWTVLDPQEIQQKFPKYKELKTELLTVNKQLIAYRSAMQTLVFDLQKN